MRRTPLQFHWVANIFSFLKVEECLGILIKRCMTLKDSTNFSSIWGIFQSCLNRKCKVKVGLSSFRPTLRWFNLPAAADGLIWERALIKHQVGCALRRQAVRDREEVHFKGCLLLAWKFSAILHYYTITQHFKGCALRSSLLHNHQNPHSKV